jgi:hypothetical protein
LLCMTIKNKLDCHTIGDQIFNFLVTELNNQNILVTNFQLVNVGIFRYAQKILGTTQKF